MSDIGRFIVAPMDPMTTIVDVRRRTRPRPVIYVVTAHPAAPPISFGSPVDFGATLCTSADVHRRLRDDARLVEAGLRSPSGPQVAEDWLQAVAAGDEHQLRRIGVYLVANNPVLQSGSDPWARAVGMLRTIGRTGEAELIASLSGRLGGLGPPDRDRATRAVQAIVDAFGYVGRLTPHQRATPGPDGRTPIQDADATIEAAMVPIRACLQSSVAADAEHLRTLRIYSSQWDATNDPLRLD